jgi:hypothetical protein
MVTIVDAVDLVVGDARSPPFSLGVAAGEIVGLLFPPTRPRAHVLRVLAGLEAPVAGEVRFPGHARVVLASSGQQLPELLSTQPDLVVYDAADDAPDRSTWALLASERALGTSIVVATANLDQACRTDRVSLVPWQMEELTRAITELVCRMAGQVHEFLGALGDRQHRRTASLAAELRRLNVGARALLGEMERRACSEEELLAWHGAAAQVAGVSVSDRVLEAAIAEGQDR